MNKMEYMTIDDKIASEIIDPEDYLNPIVRLTSVKVFPRDTTPLYRDTVAFDLSGGEYHMFSERDFDDLISKKGFRKYIGHLPKCVSYLEPHNGHLVQYFVTDDMQHLYRSRHDGSFHVENAWLKLKNRKKDIDVDGMDSWNALKNMMNVYKFGDRCWAPDLGKLEEHYYYPKAGAQLHIVFKKPQNH